MSELAVRPDTSPAPAQPAPDIAPQMARLMQWAESASAAHKISLSLVKTSFVPEAFRGKPEEATAAILAGAEVGLSPMGSLRSFDIIQGTAAPRANTLRAIVQSQGHDVWVEESTATRAVVCGQRKDSTRVQRSVWTIDRAKQLKLTSKTNWLNQPQAMLVARATSECCRLVASDAILGMPYAVEELWDGTLDAEPVADVAPARRTARRAVKAAPPMPEPALDEQPADAEPPAAPDDEPITQPQMRKMQALFTEHGMSDRDVRLSYVADLIGRDVATSSDMTKAEASRVIDALDPQPPADGDEPPLDGA
jgi:hypothetical protein